MKNLILVGGGGHCRAVIDVAEAAGYDISGILDLPALYGNTILGYRVVGSDDDIAQWVGKAAFVVTIGAVKSSRLRETMFDRIVSAGGELATVVSPLAHVSRHSSVGAGTVIMHRAVVNAGTTIGRNCIINTGADIEHDCEVDDHAHVSTLAAVNGGCRVGRGAFVGSGAVVVQGVEIADRVVVGAGSVVRGNLLCEGVYAGVPARMIIDKP